MLSKPFTIISLYEFDHQQYKNFTDHVKNKFLKNSQKKHHRLKRYPMQTFRGSNKWKIFQTGCLEFFTHR